jgi:hypothetical protein
MVRFPFRYSQEGSKRSFRNKFVSIEYLGIIIVVVRREATSTNVFVER